MALSTETPRFGVLQSLPAGYRLVRRLTLESSKVVIGLNLTGVALLVVAGLFFAWLNLKVNEAIPMGFNPFRGIESIGLALVVLVMFVLMLSVHELLHGIGFQLFGARPRYGIKLSKGVAYASAEKYYVSRNAYIVVALLPLIGISLMSIGLMLVTAGELRSILALIAAGNVGGAVGDLWFVVECLQRPRDLLVRDFGEGAELYAYLPDVA